MQHKCEGNKMLIKHATTYWAKIYIAGPIDVAKQILRLRAKRVGMCVTIEPTTYIYSGGEEAGYVVGLINYPRFPKINLDIEAEAAIIAEELRQGTGQDSYTVMTPTSTTWYTTREQ